MAAMSSSVVTLLGSRNTGPQGFPKFDKECIVGLPLPPRIIDLYYVQNSAPYFSEAYHVHFCQ